MKKLIVMAAWGDNKIYTEHICSNVNSVSKLLPGWSVRLYYDDTVPTNIIKSLKGKCELIKKERQEEYYGAWWRFEPFWDISIDKFFCSDSEVIINQQFADLLIQWKNEPFYLQRLHPTHCGVPIQSGMMGSKPGIIANFKKKMYDFIAEWTINNPRGKWYGSEQVFLAKYVWPVIKNNHLAHILKDEKFLKFTINDVEI